jgi:hypothetical protein
MSHRKIQFDQALMDTWNNAEDGTEVTIHFCVDDQPCCAQEGECACTCGAITLVKEQITMIDFMQRVRAALGD